MTVFRTLMQMKTELQHILPRKNLHVIAKSFRIDKFLSSKREAKLDSKHVPNVIYKFSCPCESSYICETKLRLEARIKSHVTQKYRSSIYQHVSGCEQFQLLFKPFKISYFKKMCLII